MQNEQIKIIWIDDEIDLLKPHILFLEQKGYHVFPINNGYDALQEIDAHHFDLVLLDENMPGLSGLDTLQRIKDIQLTLPVVMVTKNETEQIMEEAIGAHIADYLIKPINPNQILLTIKKLLQKQSIFEEKISHHYQQEFRNISLEIQQATDYEDWNILYKKILKWEIELDKTSNNAMQEILINQKKEANSQFFKFIKTNYESWIQNKSDAPILSHQAFNTFINPILKENQSTLVLMIDNLRYDQWEIIKPLITPYYDIVDDSIYYSILPSATQYARNAFFSGLTPLELHKKYPDKWFFDDEEGNKNDYEYFFLREQLRHSNKGHWKVVYEKILNSKYEKKILDEFHKLKAANLSVIVYNFIDILSHAKTDNRIINEMIRNDRTYRSLTYNWFENSDLLNIIKEASAAKMELIITTDHGTIFVKEALQIIGNKETSTNLRYKTGRQLQYNEKNVLAIDHPADIKLPVNNFISKFIFAKENFFFAYPKNYNQFVNYYKDTLQHGGISLEEIIIPICHLKAK